MARTTVVFDAWDYYEAQSEGSSLFISFDYEAASQDLTGTLQICARVIIPIQAPNENGGPVDAESDTLWRIEDELCELLAAHGVRCRLVGRLTYKGDRELVYQLDNWETFRPPVGEWIAGHPEYAIEVSEHEGWDFFDSCIRPSPEDWLWIADQSVVSNLLKSGSDPDKPHEIEYAFIGAAEALRRIADALKVRGYRPVSKLDFNTGEIVMAKTLPLELPLIFEETLANNQLAQENQAKCDGWGAMVTK